MGKLIDLTGETFGRLTVIKRVPKPEGATSSSAFWLCKCECGIEKIISGNVLRQGKAKSCGCYNRDYHFNNIKEDLTNKRFGHLVVLSRTVKPEYLHSNGAYWLCQCDCGRQITILGKSLINNHAKSCGHCRIDEVDDLTGYVFDKLTVIGRDFTRESNHNGAFWKCRCTCGNEIIVSGKNLKHQKYHSCGCQQSSGEANIIKLLNDNNISYSQQYSFKDLLGIGGRYLRFDFAIYNADKTLNRLVEFQGEQHYDSDSIMASEYVVEHDNRKKEYCLQHNIPLVLLPYWKRENMTIEDIMSERYINMEG